MGQLRIVFGAHDHVDGDFGLQKGDSGLKIAQFENRLVQIKGQAGSREFVVAGLEILLLFIRPYPLSEMMDRFVFLQGLEVKSEGGEVKKAQGSQGQGVASSHEAPHQSRNKKQRKP